MLNKTRRLLDKETSEIARWPCHQLNEGLSVEDGLLKLLVDENAALRTKAAVALQAMYHMLLCTRRRHAGASKAIMTLKQAISTCSDTDVITAYLYALTTIGRYAEFQCEQKLNDMHGALLDLRERLKKDFENKEVLLSQITTVEQHLHYIVGEQAEARTIALEYSFQSASRESQTAFYVPLSSLIAQG